MGLARHGRKYIATHQNLEQIQNHISEEPELSDELKCTDLNAERTKLYSREQLSWFYALVPEGEVHHLTSGDIELDKMDLD